MDAFPLRHELGFKIETPLEDALPSSTATLNTLDKDYSGEPACTD
jgi:hypothetical protein